ncbi:MAG: major capsid protein [Clostridia bacterium]|jgi:hypothetical protein|nr:major capsid protein [Clostridia bacterium]
MANEISIYEPRTMAAVVKRLAPVGTFFRSTFFTKVQTFPTKKIDIDFKKGSRKLAPFVSEVKGGKTVPNTGYTTNTYEPPLLAPNKVTTIDDILSRAAGESLYNAYTPQERAVIKMRDDLAELDEMIQRRIEYMCACAMMKGVIPITGDGVNYEIDFGFENTETITTDTAKWSDRTNSKPLEDISRYKRTVQKTGFINCDVLVLGAAAADDFLNNETVLKQLNLKNADLAAIKPADLPSGATYLGHIAKDNISIYTYNEWYLDDFTDPANPVEKPLMPEDSILLASTKANYILNFAGLTMLDPKSELFVTYEAEKVAHTFIKHNPDRRFIQLDSRPLPTPNEVNSWFVAKVE